MSSASATAIALLRLGTVPFVAYLLLALLPKALLPLPTVDSLLLRTALIVHASTIAAFIGGLQQAAIVTEAPALRMAPSSAAIPFGFGWTKHDRRCACSPDSSSSEH